MAAWAGQNSTLGTTGCCSSTVLLGQALSFVQQTPSNVSLWRVDQGCLIVNQNVELGNYVCVGACAFKGAVTQIETCLPNHAGWLLKQEPPVQVRAAGKWKESHEQDFKTHDVKFLDYDWYGQRVPGGKENGGLLVRVTVASLRPPPGRFRMTTRARREARQTGRSAAPMWTGSS